MPSLVVTETPALDDDHDIMHDDVGDDACVGAIAAEADRDRSAVALIDHIGREHVAILPGRALECCVGRGKLVNRHGDSL
jgi:hypothetical protein